MSCLNLACLLMTLVCLITIVLFSTSTGNQQQSSQARPARFGQQASLPATASRKLQSPADSESNAAAADQEAESMAEPSSQSLVSQRDESLFDDFRNSPTTTDYPEAAADVWSSQPARRIKLRRKSGPEREIEDSSPLLAGTADRDAAAAASSGKEDRPSSLLEPLLSQIFKDLELGSILKAALNGTAAGKQSNKPIIRRTKNGATIIISSSLNDSSLANGNDTTGANLIPSLLQKLLPPMLFKQHSPTSGSRSPFGGDNLTGSSATITITGRAIEPPQMSLFTGADPISNSGLFPFFSQPPAPRPFRAFFPEPMAMRMSSLVSAPSQFAAVPYPSALGMMLRSMAADAEEELSSANPPKFNSKLAPLKTTTAADADSKAASSNETLSTLASQPQVTSASSPNSTALNATVDPDEVETFDVSQLADAFEPPHAAHHANHRPGVSLLSPAAHQSVMIFGGGPASPERIFSGLLQSPFAATGMPMPAPHMMMLASGGPASESGPLVTSGTPPAWSSSGAGSLPMPFNPILRAILGNLAGSSAAMTANAADLDEKNKTGIDRNDQATIRLTRPFFAPFHSLASQSDDSEDRQPTASEGVRQPGAKQRADMLMDEMDSPDSDGPQLMLDMMGQPPIAEQSAPGVFRQTIRGPGAMTMERLIEVPSPAVGQQQHMQVPRGVRLQSISRLVDDNSGEDEEQQQATGGKSSSSRQSQVSPAAIERRDDNSMEGPIMLPPRMSFVGKLLSDLSRRASGPRILLSRSDLDDTQMVDDSAEAKPDQSTPAWAPKIRVAGARIRIRPSSPEALFLSPVFSQRHQSMSGDQGPEGPFEANGEQATKQISLEDTLNSMEDRLDKVLSMATQYTSTPGTRRAVITPIEKPKPMDRQQQTSAFASDNPYTSPTSPLFGFPAQSSPTSSSSLSSSTEPQQGSSDDKKSSSSSREPRSFTYHSNNEIASNMKLSAQRREQEQRDPEAAESIGRASKLGPFFVPPAGAMGRRLDDGPFGDSSSVEEQQQQPQHEPMVVGPTFLEGRAMMPAAESNNKKATVDNEAAHFRTIVV